MFYDEVVLSVEELSNDRRESSLPSSCWHFFFGLLLIFSQTKDKLVKITSWLDFWYKDTKIYEKPSNKSTRNKVQWPKDTYNPSRNIIKPAPPCTWWDWEVVDNIDIAKKDMDERYLVAFHACLLQVCYSYKDYYFNSS